MDPNLTEPLLRPGNQGIDCPGNGLHPGIECCCDECDYLILCSLEDSVIQRLFPEIDEV